MTSLRMHNFVYLAIYDFDSLRCVLPRVQPIVELQITLQPLPIPIADLELLALPAAGFADSSTDDFLALLEGDAAGPVVGAEVAEAGQRLALLGNLFLLHLRLRS